MHNKDWDKSYWDAFNAFANTHGKCTEGCGRSASDMIFDEVYDKYRGLVTNTNYANPMFPTIIFDLFIEKLIFNGPTTIVLWKDGTKTVVKCKEGDTDNKEFAFLYALAEKLYTGPKGSKNEFKRFLAKYISQAEKEEAEKNEKRTHKEKKKPKSHDEKVILKTADIIDVDLPNSNSSYCSNCHTILSPGVIYSECPKCHLIFEKHRYCKRVKKKNDC